MQEISEKWEIKIDKDIHILNGKEVDILMKAQDARFIRFDDLIINPAYVKSMRLIETDVKRIEGPDESDVPSDEWLEKHI